MTQTCIATFPAVLEDLHDFYEALKREGILFCYSGPTSQSLVEGIGEMLRQRMAVEDAGMAVTSAIFGIFIEQMQNILHYSAEIAPLKASGAAEEMRHGVVVVGREHGEEKRFFVLCGNYIDRAKGRFLAGALEEMRALSRDELKARYREARRRDPLTDDSKGAGLGFLEMARKASRPLDYCIADIGESLSFFSVKAVG